MATPLTMLRRNFDVVQLQNILLPGEYYLQDHNADCMLLVLTKRPTAHRELLLDMFIEGNGYYGDWHAI